MLPCILGHSCAPPFELRATWRGGFGRGACWQDGDSGGVHRLAHCRCFIADCAFSGSSRTGDGASSWRAFTSPLSCLLLSLAHAWDFHAYEERPLGGRQTYFRVDRSETHILRLPRLFVQTLVPVCPPSSHWVSPDIGRPCIAGDHLVGQGLGVHALADLLALAAGKDVARHLQHDRPRPEQEVPQGVGQHH